MPASKKQFLTCGRIKVELTHLDKVMYPKNKITKKEIIDYYYNIAPLMLPLMKDRAVSMLRFPDGINGEFFYQKDAAEYYPSWLKQVRIPKEGGYNQMVVCNNIATLVYLANQACLTPHLWLSRIDKLDYPDRMIFDLDPGARQSFSVVRQTALKFKEVLETIGLVPFVMTTGSRGLHVVVPLDRKANFDTVRSCAREIAELLVKQNPKQLTIEVRKNKRSGRLFIDTGRNAYGQTGVAPYALRAKLGAPIATPIAWSEVAGKKLTAQKYTIKNIFRHLKKTKNPWKKINQSARSLRKAQVKLHQFLK